MYYVAMHKRSSSKKVDLNVLAKSIVDRATMDLLASTAKSGKNPAAVLLGHLGGLKGGKARAKKLSADERKEIAQKAATARWEK